MNHSRFTSRLCLTLSLVLGSAAVSESEAPRKVAVVISTEAASEEMGNQTLYNSDYWNDLVLTADTLQANGFSEIHLLYADGDSFREDVIPSERLHAADRDTIRGLLACLSDSPEYAGGFSCEGIQPMTDQDFFFLTWLGHGKNSFGGVPNTCCACDQCTADQVCSTYLLTMSLSDYVCDCELANWVGNMSFKRRAFVFATCRAGGVIDDLEGANSVVLTSCAADGYDLAKYIYLEDAALLVAHREWVYVIDTALQQLAGPGIEMSAEGDPESRNNVVSLGEAFDWGEQQLESEMVPVLSNRSMADCTHPRLVRPSEDVEVFSMDHAYDWSSEPLDDNGLPWWEGPDLWVSRSPTCTSEIHEEPVFGQPNFVCARVHNLGCNEPVEVSVELSWVESTGWSDPSMWNSIGTTTVSVDSAASAKTDPQEWSDVPYPGSYCLHARAVHPDDPSSGALAPLDNNLVQINVSVIGALEGAWSWWPFLISNWSDADLDVIEVVFDLGRLDPVPSVVAEFPVELDIIDSAGFRIAQESGWTILTLAPGSGTDPSFRVHVASGDPVRGILKTRISPAQSGAVSEIGMAERLDGQVVGGIVFRAQHETIQVVAGRTLRLQANILRRFLPRAESGSPRTVFDPYTVHVLPTGTEKLLQAFDSLRDVYSETIATHIDELVPSGSPYKTRYLEATSRFLNVSAGLPPEARLVETVESAREQSLYAWLITRSRSLAGNQ